MTADIPIFWSAPRWLHCWVVGTLALLFALLALGAVVTSFQVGMADPVWPTRPWHLFTIDWQEPNAGFLIEHAHRLAGFGVGAAVAILALGLWWAERRPALRWLGMAAIVGLLASFGQLHGSLIKQQRLLAESGAMGAVDWTVAAGPTLVALAVLTTVVLVSCVLGGPGRGLRNLGVVLLVMVMVQGLLGGARVYLNALAGTDLAVIHGSFAQLVAATLVAIVVGTAPRRSAGVAEPELARFAAITAVLVYAQIVAGAVLRHTTSPAGARLHLLGAFVALAAILLLARRLKSPELPRSARVLRVVLHAFVGLQILLGIEAWMMRFGDGFAAAPLRRVTGADALTRTAHALSGYGLFAASVGLALALRRAPAVERLETHAAIDSPELETVV